MKLSRVNFALAAKTPLAEDDYFVLNVIYQSRLRTFFFVFGAMALFILIRSSSYLLAPDDIFQQAAGFAAILLLVILPGAFVFFKWVWVYKRDARAGFKYVIHQEVIGKLYFPHTDQYFLSLSDPKYMHHEVEQTTWNTVQVGDRFPVYFAAHSRYPFTLNARITIM